MVGMPHYTGFGTPTGSNPTIFAGRVACVEGLQVRVQIIGVCGRKRHGKDAVGRVLREHFGYTCTAFADPLKRVVMSVYDLSWDQVFGDEAEKEAVIERWGLSPRQIMQRFGTEVGRSVHPDTWIRNTLDNIHSAVSGRGAWLRNDVQREFEHRWTATPKLWVVTDVRFPNEAEAIREAGGQVWTVVRPSLGAPVDEHTSEKSVDLVVPDARIINDGSLDDLRTRVQAVLGGG